VNAEIQKAPLLKLEEDPHRRLNILTNEWILVSPNRTARPWQGEMAPQSVPSQPSYDANCYLCPGNVRSSGVRNPNYAATFVFENDYAALKPTTAPQRLDTGNKGLLVAESEPGICQVMCFSPRHDLTLSTMSVEGIASVVEAWVEQFRKLGAQQNIRHVQIFENRGAMMGASNPHPHCQIWATSSIPEAPAKELRSQQEYFRVHGSCLLCDYAGLEERQRVRMVCQNGGFLALVPFWAVWPFEILLISRRHVASMLDFTTEDIASLGEILRQVTVTYDKVFQVPFPYSMGFHQAPTHEPENKAWHFHAHFFPPLLRSATIRKFMVGFEMLGTPQRDISPEVAAERLRALTGS
jgi:UDPglucose--hexose-1-phosphate uridylyltransferase